MIGHREAGCFKNVYLLFITVISANGYERFGFVFPMIDEKLKIHPGSKQQRNRVLSLV